MKCDKALTDKLIYIFFLFLAALCGIIWSITNAGIDTTYQVAMAYRYIQGDTPILEMWEPHLTSNFINVPFMWVFLKVTGSSTGVVLYLQVIGIIIRATVAFVLFRTLKEDVSKKLSFFMSVLFFMLSPKDSAIPEFANMQVWFSVLLFCCLYKYIKNNKRIYICLSAIFMCLLALSYPSCVLVYVPVAWILWKYSVKRVETIGLFTGICVLIGALYVFRLLISVGVDRFVVCILGIISNEPSHHISLLDRFLSYSKDFAKIIFCAVVVSVISFAIMHLVGKGISINTRSFLKKREMNWTLFVSLLLCIYDIFFFLNILSAENRCAYGVVFVNTVILGMCCLHSLNDRTRVMYCIGTAISLGCMFATCLLTDLPLITSTCYPILAIVLAIIPISEKCSREGRGSIFKALNICFATFVILLAFRAFYIRTPILGRGQIFATSLEEVSLIKAGPARGIITDQNSSVKERDGYIDFNEHVDSSDRVLVIDGLVNSFVYLYTDAEIATPSVISETHFSNTMLDYYKINPQKIPNVLAVASYGGELSYEVRANEWLYNWVVNEYGATRIEEGTYWTFFYRE